MTHHKDDLTLCVAIGATGDERRAVLEHCAALRADCLRVVRCPEVEVVGELPDPVAVGHKRTDHIVIVQRGNVGRGEESFAAVWSVDGYMAHVHKSSVVGWCLASDLARDPETAVWHERTTRRVRRWDAASVPEPGTAFAWYACDDGWNVCAAKHHQRNDRAALAEKWNERDDDPILAWLPLPTLTPDAERAP